MKSFSRYSFNESARNLVTLGIFFLFAVYSGSLALNASTLTNKIVYAAITVSALAMAVWSEYLRYLYRQSLIELNMKCHSETAVQMFNRLQKADLFKAYKNTRVLFDLQVNLAQLDGQKCIEIIEKNDHFMRSSTENLMIRAYYMIRSYTLLKNKSKVKFWYGEIQKIYRLKKVPKLFSKDEIEGLNYIANNDIKKATKAFENVNTVFMNNREKIFYYYDFGYLTRSNDPIKAKQCFTAILDIGGTFPHIELASKELKQL